MIENTPTLAVNEAAYKELVELQPKLKAENLLRVAIGELLNDVEGEDRK